MEYVWLIHCVYFSPDLRERCRYQNICFRSEDEAVRFCQFHADSSQAYTWQKVQVGSYPKRRKKGVRKKEDT